MKTEKAMLKKCLVVAVIGLAGLQVSVHAADNAVVAAVNGVKIHADVLDQLVASALQQGAKDTPELRGLIKNELIAKEVLAQEAVRQGIEKSPSAQLQLRLTRSNVLADLAITKYFEKNAITDETLKAEYTREIKQLADAEQYLVSHIVVATQAEAVEVLKQLRSGATFESVAQSKSMDASRQKGGNLGWLLPNQLIEPLASVVSNMAKGALSAAPIQTQAGWQVIQLVDKRAFQAPSFEDSKPQLAQAVFAAQRAAYLQTLLKTAKVESF